MFGKRIKFFEKIGGDWVIWSVFLKINMRFVYFEVGWCNLLNLVYLCLCCVMKVW